MSRVRSRTFVSVSVVCKKFSIKEPSFRSSSTFAFNCDKHAAPDLRLHDLPSNDISKSVERKFFQT